MTTVFFAYPTPPFRLCPASIHTTGPQKMHHYLVMTCNKQLAAMVINGCAGVSPFSPRHSSVHVRARPQL